MTYPPPPVQGPPPSGKLRLRGRIPLRLAIIFLVVGIAALVIGGVIAFNGALKKVDSFNRITLPPASSQTIKSAKIDFSGTGGYIAYYESSKATSTKIPAIPVRLTSPSGKQQLLRTPYGGTSGGQDVKSLSYDYDGHKGVALWQFTITETGTYTVEVEANNQQDSDAGIAFGRSIGKSTVAGGLLVVVGVLLTIAGIVLLIVGLVKRGRHRKQLLASAGYGGAAAYPPPGYGPQYPQGQGYGQQYPPQNSPQNPQQYPPANAPQYPPQNPQGYQQPNPQQYQPEQGWQQPPSLRKDEPGESNPWPPRE